MKPPPRSGTQGDAVQPQPARVSEPLARNSAPSTHRVYDVVRGFNAWSLRNNWRLRVDGAEHLAFDGAAILAFNHLHIVDGTVAMPLVRRRIRFLCDRRALKVPLLGQVLRLLDVIPVDVGRPDRKAASAAIKALRSGELLGVFPESTVSGERGLLPGRPGAAFLADRLQVPIIPVAMWGVSAFDRPVDVYIRRKKPVITVRIGTPLAVKLPHQARRTGLQPAADAIMLTIAESLPEHLGGVYSAGSHRWQSGRLALERRWVIPAVHGSVNHRQRT